MAFDRVPTKCRALECLGDGSELWTSEVTEIVLRKSGRKSTFRWRWVVRLYMLEMDINGLIRMVDERVADERYYGQADVVESKYKITKPGLERLQKSLR